MPKPIWLLNLCPQTHSQNTLLPHAFINHAATVKLYNLRALDLKMKMPSETRPMTLNILNWDKSSSFEHRFDFLTTPPKSGKANSKKASV